MSEGWWALVGVVIGALCSGIISLFLQNRSFAHEMRMHSLENQSEENVKQVILDMLNHREHVRRSSQAIRNRIGGYSDDEIRRLLHEVNAKKADSGGKEWWYLAEREQEYINKRKGNQ